MLFEIKFLFSFALLLVMLVAECSTVKKAEHKHEPNKEERLKRDTIFATPIYYDAVPYQAVQPAAGTPAAGTPTPPPQAQPLLGALISNVPGLSGITSTLTTLLPFGGLANWGNLGGLGGLGNLGNLGNLGGLGGLGGLTNLAGLGNLPLLGNLGGLLPGGIPRCPLTQRLNCRCENLLPLPLQPAPATRSSTHSNGLEVLQHNIKFNLNGDKEMSARLSNGLLFYQRTSLEKLANNKSSKVFQGFYTLKVKDNKYLTIYYTLNDLDYTVKADVTAEPPQNDLDELTTTSKF